jgi:hypothetical protein
MDFLANSLQIPLHTYLEIAADLYPNSFDLYLKLNIPMSGN